MRFIGIMTQLVVSPSKYKNVYHYLSIITTSHYATYLLIEFIGQAHSHAVDCDLFMLRLLLP